MAQSGESSGYATNGVSFSSAGITSSSVAAHGAHDALPPLRPATLQGRQTLRLRFRPLSRCTSLSRCLPCPPGLLRLLGIHGRLYGRSAIRQVRVGTDTVLWAIPGFRDSEVASVDMGHVVLATELLQIGDTMSDESTQQKLPVLRSLVDVISLENTLRACPTQVKLFDNLILTRYFSSIADEWSDWWVAGICESAAEFEAIQRDLQRLADAAGWEGSTAATVTLPKAEYVELLEDQLRLSALQAGGVDNWDWYGDSVCKAGRVDPDTLEVTYPDEDEG